MDILHKKSCKSGLNFQPRKKWPDTWPAFSWDRQLITGFDDCFDKVLNFQSENVKFSHLFFHCYPHLGLSELSRIVTQWEKQSEFSLNFFSWKDFFFHYKIHQDVEFIKKQLKFLFLMPSYFQTWIDAKEVHLNELRILHSMKNEMELDFIFQWLSEQNISHSIGVRALELAGELKLMGLKETEILYSNLSPSSALQMMESKRKPITFSQTEQRQQTLKKINWPLSVKAQWNRRGDEEGLELHLWSKNQKSLMNQLEQIGKIDNLNKLFK